MKRINRDGPRILGERGAPPVLADDGLQAVLDSGATVADTRTADRYAVGHVPGTLNIPLTRMFTTWAGWLVPYDADFYLIGDPGAVAEAIRDLAMVGLDRLAGVFRSEAVEYRAAPRSTVGRVDAGTLARMAENGEVTVLDIRGAAEWEAARIPEAVHIPLGYLPERIDEVPTDRPVAVYCESGGRSAIAASVLDALGVADVLDFQGGIRAWLDAGRPTERGPALPGAGAEGAPEGWAA